MSDILVYHLLSFEIQSACQRHEPLGRKVLVLWVSLGCVLVQLDHRLVYYSGYEISQIYPIHPVAHRQYPLAPYIFLQI